MPQRAILNLSLQDSKTVTTLHDILLKERTALEKRDAEALESLLGEKQTYIDQLNANAQRRSELLTELGFEHNRKGMSQYIATLPIEDQEELSTRWQELESTLEKCKELNLVNAKVLQHTRAAVDRLLTIYRGSAVKSVSLYGEDGAATRGNEHRSITKA
ncbi:flagella synthesis protein FlgN [Aestuariirhabdus sp. LZHN29]|uniref:flagella synthesis protein FlgN n=1 Tax=Aestuariirhabdus sp. LZHN29 TaxID=3417462 RepID=UPI003CF2B3F7